MSIKNPIRTTSLTFNTVINDINSIPELRDKPEWFKHYIAGSHEILAMYINAQRNQAYLRTAFTRGAVADLLALIDYQMKPQSTSSGKLIFYLDPDKVVFPKIISRQDLNSMSQGSTQASSKKFIALEGRTQVEEKESFIVEAPITNEIVLFRNYITGEKVRIKKVTPGSILPSPLQEDTDYWTIFSKKQNGFNYIFLADSLESAYKGIPISLLDVGSGGNIIQLYSVLVEARQQEELPSLIVGKSDGQTAWQEFPLSEINILKDTVTVFINGESWSIQEKTLLYSNSTDFHLLLRYNTDNSCYLLFGDGTYGAIPAAFDIEVTYSIGGGTLSNVYTKNRINIYSGGDSDIIGVSNPIEFTGGGEPESIESAKKLGPMLLKSQDRFIYTEDGEALAEGFEGVAIAKANPNKYGHLSCQIVIVPEGGGLPDSSLKSSLQEYLISKTILRTIDVRVDDPNYVIITPVVDIKIRNGYTFENELDFITLAFRLLFYPATNKLKENYSFDFFVRTINELWGYSFSLENQIQLENLIENVSPTYFGKHFQLSDIYGYLDSNLMGVDYITLVEPSIPIICNNDQITLDNVIKSNMREV